MTVVASKVVPQGDKAVDKDKPEIDRDPPENKQSDQGRFEWGESDIEILETPSREKDRKDVDA